MQSAAPAVRVKRKLFDPTYVPLERRKTNILTCILLWSILCFVLVNRFVLASVEVVGTSMRPTLNHGERHFMHRWLYYFREPVRGDLVMIIEAGRRTDAMVKRIVGLPGESVQIVNGRVHIDGRPLEEPYLRPGSFTLAGRYGGEPLAIPPGYYFVLGDNRLNSEDSRSYGPVPRQQIVGYIAP